MFSSVYKWFLKALEEYTEIVKEYFIEEIKKLGISSLDQLKDADSLYAKLGGSARIIKLLDGFDKNPNNGYLEIIPYVPSYIEKKIVYFVAPRAFRWAIRSIKKLIEKGLWQLDK